jgi:hypothetical protein
MPKIFEERRINAAFSTTDRAPVDIGKKKWQSIKRLSRFMRNKLTFPFLCLTGKYGKIS